MTTEFGKKQSHSDLWPWIILTVLALAVVGEVIALRLKGEEPSTPETIVQSTATPVPPALSQAAATPLLPPPSPHIFITPSPAPPTPAPRTPAPVTATPKPAPTDFALTLRVTNPDYGAVSVEPYSPTNRYPKDTRVALSATAKPGNKFTGWSGDAASTQSTITVVMDRDRTVSGDFASMSYALKIDPSLSGGAISLLPNMKSYQDGAKVTVQAQPSPGYIFQSWTGDAAGSENPLTVTMSSEKKIGATFVPGQYALVTRVNPSGFIDISPPGAHQDSGVKVTLTARAPDYYHFGSWSGDASGTNPTITVTMDANKTITANFIRTYILTTVVSPPGYGAVTPAMGVYDEGTQITLTAQAISGYEFVDWSGSISGSSPITQITMGADKTAEAHFQPTKFPPFQ